MGVEVASELGLGPGGDLGKLQTSQGKWAVLTCRCERFLYGAEGAKDLMQSNDQESERMTLVHISKLK